MCVVVCAIYGADQIGGESFAAAKVERKRLALGSFPCLRMPKAQTTIVVTCATLAKFNSSLQR